MEDKLSLVLRNTCKVCGLPLKIQSFEKNLNNIDIDTKITIKLICQNLEHKDIIELSIEEYKSLIDESLENICKCSLCNKILSNRNTIPHYCYKCKKIICSDCLKNKHEKRHKNVFNYNDLNNKCLIHNSIKNENDYFCLICKNNYCLKCVTDNLNHTKDHDIKKKTDYLDEKFIKNGFINIKNEQKKLNEKKEKLLEEIKNLDMINIIYDFLLKENNNYIHILKASDNKPKKPIMNKTYFKSSQDVKMTYQKPAFIGYQFNKEDTNKKYFKIDNKSQKKENNQEENKITQLINKDDNKEENKLNKKEENIEKNKVYNLENNKMTNKFNIKDINIVSIKATHKVAINKEGNKLPKTVKNKETNIENNKVLNNKEDNKTSNKEYNIRQNKVNNKIGNIFKIDKKYNKDINNKEINAINIIYYDENVKYPGKDIMDDCYKLSIGINGSIILVNDLENLDLLIKNLKKKYPNNKYFFIVNGSSANSVINFIKENKYNSIFIKACIYTQKIKRYSAIKENNPDFIGEICTKQEKIITFIKNEFQKYNGHNEKIYINSLINLMSYKKDYFYLHQELSKFYGDETDIYNTYFLLITNYITNGNINLTKNEKDNLINCFQIFSELKNKNYEKIIICYLKDYNFQNFLNSLLIEKDLSTYVKIGYFAGNLMYSIVQYGKNEGKGIDSGYTFYKGMELNIIDLLEFLKNRDNEITFPYFFAISEKKQFAEITSKRYKTEKERKSKEIYSVIMEIKYLYDDGYEPCIYNLNDLCQYPDEEEFIILPFTFLILKKITINSKNLTADLELEVIGKTEILEEKIKESKTIDFDRNNQIMIPK